MNKLVNRFLKQVWFEYFILSIILISFVIVRLYKINGPVADWHSWRQVDTASVTRTYVEQGLDLLHPRYHDISAIQTGYFNPNGYRFVEFPIFNFFHYQVFKAFPQIGFDTSGRLVSIVSALITSISLYILGRKLFSRWVGILAMFFYAQLPFNVYFTRVILPDPLSVSLAVLGVLFFVFYIEDDKKPYLFASSLFFAFSLLAKPFTIFYGLPVAYLVIKKMSIKSIFRNKSLFLALDIALVPLFLWRAWMNNYSVGIPHIKWAYNGDGIRFRPSFWRWIFGERIGKLILGIWGMVPFSIGLLTKHKKITFVYFFLLGMFLYLTIIATANVRHDYYQIFIIPAISLVLGIGFVNLWETKIYSKLAARIVLLFSVFMMFGTSWYEIRSFYAINDPSIIVAGKAADTILPKDALVIAPYNGNTAFLYQTKRWGWPVVNESIESMIEKGADFYISVNLNDTDTTNFSKKYQAIARTDKYVILDLGQKLE
jgi:4-amino-4-deoxy-L-arabinose transferase-like glycosyltransferase